MRVLALLASPRRNGNTEILLDEAIRGARSKGANVEKIAINNLKFLPCQNCGGCDKTGICVIKDDMQKIYRKIKYADGIIIASPVYFGSLSAQAKAMIDRFQSAWVGKYMLKNKIAGKKKGVFLCVSGSGNRKFFEAARKIVKYLFATNDIRYKADFFAPRADKKGDIRKYPDALKKAYALGEGLVK
ncbi:MAG: flavodoxin family protein [Candidatus Omnitrophota bacterium]